MILLFAAIAVTVRRVTSRANLGVHRRPRGRSGDVAIPVFVVLAADRCEDDTAARAIEV